MIEKLKAQFEGLVDLVQEKGRSTYLVKEGQELLMVDQVERNGELYVPPELAQIPWLMPRAKEVLRYYRNDNDKQLYDDLFAYFKANSDLPLEEHYHLLVIWAFHTYLLEAARYSPYIWFYADAECGKTRTGKAMSYVGFRGIHVESLTEAHLIRWATYYRATMFLDVVNIMKKAKDERSLDLLLQRFERDLKVTRVLRPELGPFKDMEMFEVFGATVIATNESVDETLRSRAIQINIQASNRQFDEDLTAQGTLPLKERLVAFRARHLGITLPDVPKPAPRRLGDILKPLYQVVDLVDKERIPVFQELVRKLQAARTLEKSETLEGQIVRAVLTLKDKLTYVNGNPVLSVKIIAGVVNRDKSEREQLREVIIGRRLTALGFRRTSTREGYAGIVWDEEYNERLRVKYGAEKSSGDSGTSSQPSEDYENGISLVGDESIL